MMRKVYFSKDKQKFQFSAKVNDEVKNITFLNFGGSFGTSDKGEQEAIENSFYFKKGLIYLAESTQEKEDVSPDDDKIVREDVPDYQTARQVLMSEYGLKPQAVPNNPDGILKAAAKVGVLFPNL